MAKPGESIPRSSAAGIPSAATSISAARNCFRPSFSITFCISRAQAAQLQSAITRPIASKRQSRTTSQENLLPANSHRHHRTDLLSRKAIDALFLPARRKSARLLNAWLRPGAAEQFAWRALSLQHAYRQDLLSTREEISNFYAETCLKPGIVPLPVRSGRGPFLRAAMGAGSKTLDGSSDSMTIWNVPGNGSRATNAGPGLAERCRPS